MNALELLEHMLQPGTMQRSTEYRDGALSQLRWELDAGYKPTLPYMEGSAKADAWLSGMQHAKDWWRTVGKRIALEDAR